MILLVFLSVFLPSATSSSEWLPKCGATQRQSLHGLISTDIFLRHFSSGVLNDTLSECSNFHRHLCPKKGPPAEASVQGLVNQIVAIERGCTKYDLLSVLEGHFAFADQFDEFDYQNNIALSALLFLMPKSTLLTIYEYTTLHLLKPLNFYSDVWERRHWTSAIDQATFPAKYDSSIFVDFTKKKNFVKTLAGNIKNITETCGGVKAMTNFYLPFLKDVTDYNHVLNVMFREGYESGAPRLRHHESIIGVSNEYDRVLQTAAWSTLDNNGKTRYDRFYDFTMDVFHNTLKSSLYNVGVQNASATFSKDFYNFYFEERNKLSSLAVLPHLRNLIAANRAHERIVATADLDLPTRWKITAGAQPNTLSAFYVWIIVRNRAIYDLVQNNSPDAAAFGAIAYTYGHEMYHGVERDLYPSVMPDSPVRSASVSCVNATFGDIAQRFPGDARFTFWPMEEQADVYGAQITYGAFKTFIGNRIDDLAYPSLNITQRQLFFYSNAIFGCNVHDPKSGTFLNIIDSHYRVNGRLAQVSDFQSTFKCAATDKMVIQESDHCPIFFPSFAA